MGVEQRQELSRGNGFSQDTCFNDAQDYEGQIKKPDVVVPWEEAVKPFLLDGNVDVYLGDGKLARTEEVLTAILRTGVDLTVVGKFAWTGALRMGGCGEVTGLNNDLRHWFIYTGPTGEEAVDYLPHTRAFFDGEGSLFISDIDLKSSQPIHNQEKLFPSSDQKMRLTKSRLPSRDTEVVDIELAEPLWQPDLRLSITPIPQTERDVRLDRRWAGINRIGMIRAQVVLGERGLEVNYASSDIAMILHDPDSYYPQYDDSLDKIVVTVSRMMVSAAMRQQLGLVTAHYRCDDMFTPESILTVREVLKNKKHRTNEVLSDVARKEVLVNLILSSLVEPNMIRMVPKFGMEEFLPSHLQSVDWQRVVETSIKTWIFNGDNFSEINTLARVVKTLTQDERFVEFHEYKQLDQLLQVEQNVMAMNWMLSGEFGI